MAESAQETRSSIQENRSISGSMPAVRRISTADLVDALKRGFDDFRAMPTHLLFLGVIYALLGVILVRLAFNYDMLHLAFPLVAGFALIGPFTAVGLYELSRRRERGLDTRWWHMFDVVRSPSFGAILIFGLILLAIFGLWLGVASKVYALTFGAAPTTMAQFLNALLTTNQGWALIILGNGAGAIFGLVVLAISVVSLPLLVDRPAGFVMALMTSLKAVALNPLPMIVWGVIVLAMLLIGSLPLFIGLAIVLPVLGHATWHLYTKVVER